MTNFNCHRCRAPVIVTRYTQRRMMTENMAERCRRCGAVHTVSRGLVEVISPPMLPVDRAGRVSPWMLWFTRPIHAGWYECRFTDLEPQRISLWWNGQYFQVADVDARRVLMVTFLSWRGTWPPSNS